MRALITHKAGQRESGGRSAGWGVLGLGALTLLAVLVLSACTGSESATRVATPAQAAEEEPELTQDDPELTQDDGVAASTTTTAVEEEPESELGGAGHTHEDGTVHIHGDGVDEADGGVGPNVSEGNSASALAVATTTTTVPVPTTTTTLVSVVNEVDQVVVTPDVEVTDQDEYVIPETGADFEVSGWLLDEIERLGGKAPPGYTFDQEEAIYTLDELTPEALRWYEEAPENPLVVKKADGRRYGCFISRTDPNADAARKDLVGNGCVLLNEHPVFLITGN